MPDELCMSQREVSARPGEDRVAVALGGAELLVAGDLGREERRIGAASPEGRVIVAPPRAAASE